MLDQREQPTDNKLTNNKAMFRNRYIGYVERITNGILSGRVTDKSGVNEPIILFVFINGKPVATISCAEARRDFVGLPLESHIFGFSYKIPAVFLDGSKHEISLRFQSGTFVMFPDNDGNPIDHGSFQITPPMALQDSPEVLNLSLTETELHDVTVIEQSGVFDSDWYCAANTDVAATDISAIVHYVKYGAAEGRNPTATFNTRKYRELKGPDLKPWQNPFAYFITHGTADELFDRGMLSAFEPSTLQKGIARLSHLPIYSDNDYLKLNSDLVTEKIEPSHHALTYGFSEGRSVFNKATVARVIGRLSRASLDEMPPKIPANVRAGASTVGVYFNSLGNGFIKEIANDLVASLRGADMTATLLDEKSNIDERPPIAIIVAPHEFFHLGSGQEWAREDVVCKSFMFNTEQPQTIWFERGIPFCLMSLGVIDICAQVAMMFAETTMPALHFNPEVIAPGSWLLPHDMSHSFVRILPKALRASPRPETAFMQRRVDISFFGGTSEHRDSFFARNARFFADYECFLYYRRFEGPHANSKRDGVLSRLAGHVTAHSKIALNIHRDDYGFFEWHRIVKIAMAGGSLVVSEPNLPHSVYKTGVHFFEECGRHMPDLLDWLLKTDDGRIKAEEVRTNALSLVYDQAVIKRHRASLRAFLSNPYNAARASS